MKEINNLPYEITETGITIDHDTHEVMIDTNCWSMVCRFRRLGFVETTEENSKPYYRFKCNEDILMITKKKKMNPLSPEELRKRLDSMKKINAARSSARRKDGNR